MSSVLKTLASACLENEPQVLTSPRDNACNGFRQDGE